MLIRKGIVLTSATCEDCQSYKPDNHTLAVLPSPRATFICKSWDGDTVPVYSFACKRFTPLGIQIESHS
jgi:hypothetical protein